MRMAFDKYQKTAYTCGVGPVLILLVAIIGFGIAKYRGNSSY